MDTCLRGASLGGWSARPGGCFAMLSRAMHTLITISIVAALALLWASISIAQHVRRARERRDAVEDANQPAVAFENEGLKEEAVQSVSQSPVPFANAHNVERIDWDRFNKELGNRGEPGDPSGP
jgi:hypothetical protein